MLAQRDRGLFGVRPPCSVKIMLLLYVVSSDPGVVVVFDGPPLQRETVDHHERHPRVTLADVLVTVASKGRGVAAVTTFERLQTLTHGHSPLFTAFSPSHKFHREVRISDLGQTLVYTASQKIDALHGVPVYISSFTGIHCARPPTEGWPG